MPRQAIHNLTLININFLIIFYAAWRSVYGDDDFDKKLWAGNTILVTILFYIQFKYMISSSPKELGKKEPPMMQDRIEESSSKTSLVATAWTSITKFFANIGKAGSAEERQKIVQNPTKPTQP